MITLQIGAIIIPMRAGLDLEQSYEPIGGYTVQRTLNGTGIPQRTWRRTRITISGGGWLPAGLETIDTTVSQAVACIVPRAMVADASRQATLPASRRADSGHTPWAFAILPSGDVVNTPVDLAGNLATADAVAGAVAYHIQYFPLITCWIHPPVESGSRGDASYRWELVAEEA